MQTEFEKRTELARELAVEGGRQTLPFFQRAETGYVRKQDNSPVTEADRAAETWIRARIEREFPDDAIVGEEFGERQGSSEFEWIIDPIDGTKSFITGVPLYGTMVGVLVGGQPQIGATYFPGLDELIVGAEGQPTMFGSPGGSLAQAQVADIDDFDQCIFVVSEARTFVDAGVGHVFEKLQSQCYVTRTWGDCYGYYLVATGRAHLMIDPILQIWDAAAAAPIVRGAGGRFIDWRGDSHIDSGHAIGCVPSLVNQVLELTSPAAQHLPGK